MDGLFLLKKGKGEPERVLVSKDTAEKNLAKSRNWLLPEDSSFVLVGGKLYPKGKEPEVKTPPTVTLVSKQGREEVMTDIELAEKMLRKSEKKGTWTLSDKTKDFKYDNGYLVKTKAKAKSKPKAKAPEAEPVDVDESTPMD